MDWRSYQNRHFHDQDTGFFLDLAGLDISAADSADFEKRFKDIHAAMTALEAGEIANPDEGRMVGHYWLRATDLAPSDEIRAEIESTLEDIVSFSADIHAGVLRAADNQTFTDLLVIGIGGSALGPQFVSDALAPHDPALKAHFLDNTDPAGIDRVLDRLDHRFHRTLVVVISKSGGTPETRNGMVETMERFKGHDIDFARQAVAITGDNSKLYERARAENWLKIFPMWDWVGGRTSETSVVGMLPAALQGIDFRAILAGACSMDAVTRQREPWHNPAALLCLAWYVATEGRGSRDMVILPYKDSLLLFSRYLQQLIMESLGKEFDLDGKRVEQGISVYGNKGSTDQHAYVQQLRDGINNFFVTFIEVLKDREGSSIPVDGVNTSGDYLFGFLQGTREALAERGRASITLSIPEVTPFAIGALIALYERTVGFYAALVNINAYHQPGVEAGKQAAVETLAILNRVRAVLKGAEAPVNLVDLKQLMGIEVETELIYRIIRRLHANGQVVLASGSWSEPDTLKFKSTTNT